VVSLVKERGKHPEIHPSFSAQGKNLARLLSIDLLLQICLDTPLLRLTSIMLGLPASLLSPITSQTGNGTTNSTGDAV